MRDRGFTQGVKPGGLFYNSDIKILICYMIASVGGDIKKDDVMEAIQKNSLANYFETSDAFAELVKQGHIACTDEKEDTYSNTATGETIAEQLVQTLPYSVRETAVKTALQLKTMSKNKKDNHVTIEKQSNGFRVNCAINDNEIELMSFSINVLDMVQAKQVEENFLKDPEVFYRHMLALASGEKSFLYD